MFDIGFFELLIIFVVALVVIGPERLPSTVRSVSLWIGRLKRSLRETRSELEEQIGADDIRRQLHNEEIMKSLGASKDEIDRALNSPLGEGFNYDNVFDSESEDAVARQPLRQERPEPVRASQEDVVALAQQEQSADSHQSEEHHQTDDHALAEQIKAAHAGHEANSHEANSHEANTIAEPTSRSAIDDLADPGASSQSKDRS